MISIDQARCSGCGSCLAACKFRLLSFQTSNWKKTTVIEDIDRCTGCGMCSKRCPIGAISALEQLAASRRRREEALIEC